MLFNLLLWVAVLVAVLGGSLDGLLGGSLDGLLGGLLG